MSLSIHPTAIVDPAAQLGAGTVIGPYCVVGPAVSLGENCTLQNHVTLAGPLTAGSGNKFYAFCSIGQQSQDLKYRDEPTYLEIGNENCFREFCTVNRSTTGDGKTRVGSRGNFLAYSHIGHDCAVGDAVIFSNNGTLAGHVQVGDHAVIGGLTAVHQFCRIGRFAITGGCSKIVQDVLPFMIADGNPAEVHPPGGRSDARETGRKRRGAGDYRLHRGERARDNSLGAIDGFPKPERRAEQDLKSCKRMRGRSLSASTRRRNIWPNLRPQAPACRPPWPCH